jgi:hypothetical protein
MATQADIRRIALSLPETSESKSDFAFSVMNKGKAKGFAWVWKERVNPKKPRIPNHTVLAIRVPSNLDKDMMIAAEPTKYFTEPHYAGFPAVLVRISEVSVREMRTLLEDGWRCLAPRELLGDAPKAKKKTKAR